MFSYIRRNYILISVVFLIVFIIALVGAIYYLFGSPPKVSSQDFSTIKQQAVELAQDNQIASDKNYSKLVDNLNTFDLKSMSRKDQLNLLKLTLDNALNAYFNTNNPKLYTFQKNLVEFINKNYPENGKIDMPHCLDPSCAENPQSKAILNVIEEINKSNVPQELKNEIVKELTTYSYINNDNYAKAYDYIFVAEDIRHNQEFINSGFSEKWANDIENYVKTEFPNEFAKIRIIRR